MYKTRTRHNIKDEDIEIAKKNGIKLRTLRSRVYKGVDIKLATILPYYMFLTNELSDLLDTLEKSSITITNRLLKNIKNSGFKYCDIKKHVVVSGEVEKMFEDKFVINTNKWIVIDTVTGETMEFKVLKDISEHFGVTKQAVSSCSLNKKIFRNRYIFKKRAEGL